jgi:hypothetical protein
VWCKLVVVQADAANQKVDQVLLVVVLEAAGVEKNWRMKG